MCVGCPPPSEQVSSCQKKESHLLQQFLPNGLPTNSNLVIIQPPRNNHPPLPHLNHNVKPQSSSTSRMRGHTTEAGVAIAHHVSDHRERRRMSYMKRSGSVSSSDSVIHMSGPSHTHSSRYVSPTPRHAQHQQAIQTAPNQSSQTQGVPVASHHTAPPPQTTRPSPRQQQSVSANGQSLLLNQLGGPQNLRPISYAPVTEPEGFRSLNHNGGQAVLFYGPPVTVRPVYSIAVLNPTPLNASAPPVAPTNPPVIKAVAGQEQIVFSDRQPVLVPTPTSMVSPTASVISPRFAPSISDPHSFPHLNNGTHAGVDSNRDIRESPHSPVGGVAMPSLRTTKGGAAGSYALSKIPSGPSPRFLKGVYPEHENTNGSPTMQVARTALNGSGHSTCPSVGSPSVSPRSLSPSPHMPMTGVQKLRIEPTPTSRLATGLARATSEPPRGIVGDDSTGRDLAQRRGKAITPLTEIHRRV